MALLQEDDDFFGADDEADTSLRRCTDGHELHSGLAEAEAAATKSRYQNLGFHAAYDDNKDLKVQPGFEAGYQAMYDSAFRIGELLGEATMEYKLANGKPTTVETNERTSEPYLVAAKKIRGVLTHKGEKEESTKQAYDLRSLERDVDNIVKS